MLISKISFSPNSKLQKPYSTKETTKSVLIIAKTVLNILNKHLKCS